MANLSPLTSQSPSKENDSIDEGARGKAAKNRDDDDFEDSLNVSISEHISEEIESMNNSSAVEDSIEKPARRFDQLMIEKKRKLFDFDDSDKSEATNSDGIRKFSKFDAINLDDESLTGDNIAKHFLVESETSAQPSGVNERLESDVSQCTKSDELKIADSNEGAANSAKTNVETSSNRIDEMQKSKDYSNLVEFVQQSVSQKATKSGNSGSHRDEKNDVILINDQQISIHSLKELQEQRSQSDSDQNVANRTNQNTTSDFSDLQNEENAKEQKSIDDISAVSINESTSQSKVESQNSKSEVDRSKSVSNKSDRSKSESHSDDKPEESTKNDEENENVQLCRPMDEDLLPELSVIEEVSAGDEQSSNRNAIESSTEKKSEMRKIIDETVNKLPLDKENRPPNLLDDVGSVDSKRSYSNATDITAYNTLANFEEEFKLNLITLESRIKELNTGKYSLSQFELPSSIGSRRGSLKDSLKDCPQSGRESISIQTNSTEYRPFQEEYFRMTDLQVALFERDKMIQELTDAVKKSVAIRDQLKDQNQNLEQELNELKAGNKQRQWITDRNTFDDPERQISETTIDLVEGSDFEDDDLNNKNESKPDEQIDSKPAEQQKRLGVDSTFGEFKECLTENEVALFTRVQAKFEQLLNDKVNDIKAQLQQEQFEKAELDAEANRLRQLLANIKCGSTEVMELRNELEKNHKKEMENLRMYFEQKCTDLEKQYSEDVFSQHSRRHSNDTNSDLSDDELFLPDEAKSGGIRRTSKTGDILASPTHRKLTPTNIRSAESSPLKRVTRKLKSEFRSFDEQKLDNLNADEIHEHYRNVIANLKQSHEEKIKHLKFDLQSMERPPTDDEYLLTATTSTDQPLVLLTSENLKNNREYTELFNNLVSEYDRRLEEQVKLAKQDMLHELEVQIQTLLSEPISDESRWPPELILLREKFTAKSQLEIAQLQIKHEEEMSRLKTDHQKQLNRKIKRHTDFDTGRGLEKNESERDNLRELCNTFRHVLYELAKCVLVCENDLNASLVEELNKAGVELSPSESLRKRNEADLNQSTCSSIANQSIRPSLPDVSSIISLVEDPSLLDFVNERCENESCLCLNASSFFDLNECLEKLKSEADSLLQLSQQIIQKRAADNRELDETQKTVEEEDGLKISKDDFNIENAYQKPRHSLPSSLTFGKSSLSHSDLKDLKNRLLSAETKNQELEKRLAESLAQQNELTQKLNSYLDSQSEELSEGYGISQLRSPQRHPANKPVTSFSTLQERAKQYFNDTSACDVSQLLEDFCRECDRHVDEEKDKMKDYQAQIDAAYNQRKQDLEYLEKQAAERETERDDFCKKIDKLESKLRDVDKERVKFDNIAKECESLRQQIQEMETALTDSKKVNSSLQTDLKESISKIFDLREIIVELEKQIKEKDNLVKSLEDDIECQKTTTESLQVEMKNLLTQTEVTPTYEEKIHQLEEQLESLQPNADQSAAIERIACHLQDIEENLDRKINLLESIHVGTGTITTCSSPSEDVSVRGSGNNLDSAISPRYFKYLAKDPSFPVDQIMRILEKMQKHSKVEEAAIKLVRDLEMQIKALHTSYMELQNERDLLKEKMDEQLVRITSIQSRLDEQRQRAEELQRAGTSDLNLKLYDLQAEVKTLKETVSSRDKQISVLKNHLAQSKEIIDKQEAEIASHNCVSDGNDTYSKIFVEKLEARIATKDLENKNLRDKMRSEMITKMALPDLMETMLADKTDEIEFLKEQLEARDKELKELRESKIFAKAEEKLSEYFAKSATSYFDNDYIRKPSDSGTRLSLNPVNVFGNNENTPPSQPRLINFSPKSPNDVHSVQTPLLSLQSSNVTKNDSLDEDASITQLKDEIEYLKLSLEDKTKLVDDVTAESRRLKDEYDEKKHRLEHEIENLRGQVDDLQSKIETIEAELTLSTKNYDTKCNEFNAACGQLKEERANNGVIKQQLNSMENTIKMKDELITKLQKDIDNFIESEKENFDTIHRLKREHSELRHSNDNKIADTSEVNKQLRDELTLVKQILAETSQELSEKCIDYEKCLLDMKEQEKKIFHLTDILTDSKTARSVEEMRIEIRTHREQNERLKFEIEDLKRKLAAQRSVTSSPARNDANRISEISSRIEKELNFSDQFDANALKAIDENDGESDIENEDELDAIKAENKEMEKVIQQLQHSLESEREKFTFIHQQDVNCIEAVKKRLEEVIESETKLNMLLEEERNRTSQLSTKILEHQFERAKLSASNLSLNESPISSPRRLQKGGESDQELLKCQNDEIKLLKSQLEREKERAADTERALAREKSRFEKEMVEQKAYGERMKDELERIIRENKTLQDELDDAQEKLTLSMRDVDNLQARLKHLQDADSYRNARNEKDRQELAQSIATCRELKTKLINLERERDVLQERVSILQTDIDRGAQREARLTESLVAGYQQSNVISGGLMPQQLLAKLKEMNDNLSENVRENRQLSETLQLLTDERHVLQKKVHDLEIVCIDRDELEERANHLFGKYLRTESFRRALIHQKRYLMILLNTYESNEARVLNALNGNNPMRRKLPSFKSVVLVAVAVERMKFILRRWQTGKRVCAKNPIFPHNTPPRRTHSASTINWSRNGNDTQLPNPQLHHPQSPPIRERPMTSVLKGRRCTNNDFTTPI